MNVQLRTAHADDHPAVIEAIGLWWQDSRTPEQARQLASLVPALFLEHFASTSLLAEQDSAMAGFLIAFYSQDHDDEAYIHFVGVDPDLRAMGIARRMYETFFTGAAEAGRTTVRAVTSPGNTGSIAFHRRLGFAVSQPASNGEADQQSKVRFTRELG